MKKLFLLFCVAAVTGPVSELRADDLTGTYLKALKITRDRQLDREKPYTARLMTVKITDIEEHAMKPDRFIGTLDDGQEIKIKGQNAYFFRNLVGYTWCLAIEEDDKESKLRGMLHIEPCLASEAKLPDSVWKKRLINNAFDSGKHSFLAIELEIVRHKLDGHIHEFVQKQKGPGSWFDPSGGITFNSPKDCTESNFGTGWVCAAVPYEYQSEMVPAYRNKNLSEEYPESVRVLMADSSKCLAVEQVNETFNKNIGVNSVTACRRLNFTPNNRLGQR